MGRSMEGDRSCRRNTLSEWPKRSFPQPAVAAPDKQSGEEVKPEECELTRWELPEVPAYDSGWNFPPRQ